VSAEQLELGVVQDGAQRREGLPAGEGDTELLVFVAVEMNSWPPAWMPVVTRTMTGTRVLLSRPASRASSATRSISAKESTTTRPTPASIAREISASDLLLPCRPISAPGTPARRATASSPPVQVSTRRPSSRAQRATATDKKDLPA